MQMQHLIIRIGGTGILTSKKTGGPSANHNSLKKKKSRMHLPFKSNITHETDIEIFVSLPQC
jgi:hypothetical protein